MSRGIGLVSGGLDSILAVKVIQEQGIEVLGIAFVTPFFGAERAVEAAEQLGIELRVMDISEEHLAMVKAPAHGYGKTMNPCIDCHTLMLKCAGRVMEAEGYDFLFTGEVLGERPMSQNAGALKIVAEGSGYRGFIVRPLSAQVLPETEVEKKGLVDRGRLLGISGRGRKPQMALAEQYGIRAYPTPAGGCLLTEKQFSLRLEDLLTHNPEAGVREAELLKVGRHFRMGPRTKMICGRNHEENERIRELAGEGEALMSPVDVPGPTALVVGEMDEGVLKDAAALVVRYSDVNKGDKGCVRVKTPGGEETVEVVGAEQERIEQLLIK